MMLRFIEFVADQQSPHYRRSNHDRLVGLDESDQFSPSNLGIGFPMDLPTLRRCMAHRREKLNQTPQ